MTRTRRHPFALGSAILLAVAAPTAAQNITWLGDYNTARREAVQQGKPIFIDFVTDNCLWCKKLEQGTFRDPAIAAYLTGQFVTLKSNADLDPTLAQALRVQTYPTMVLAAPDGKILGMIEGYMEPARLAEHLQRAVQTVAAPDWMTRDFQEASRAVATGDYAKAITLLKGIGEDGQQRPVQQKARQVFAEIEQQAAGRLAKAKQLEDRGQPLDATDTLAALLKNYPGTQAATEGSRLLSKLAEKTDVKPNRARDLLAEVRDDYRLKSYAACLEKCETLTASFTNSPEATEAKQIAGQIKANPEWVAAACDALQEKLAGMYLTQAEAWLAKGDAKQAAVCLERVARDCAGTTLAQTALAKLHQVRGETTSQTNFKKP